MSTSAGDGSGADDVHRTSRRIRKEIDRPGLRASIAADVSTVVSTGSGSATSRQQVNVRQGRSDGTGPSARGEGRSMTDQPGLTPEELDAESGEGLPDREQMSLVN